MELCQLHKISSEHSEQDGYLFPSIYLLYRYVNSMFLSLYSQALPRTETITFMFLYSLWYSAVTSHHSVRDS